MSWTLEEALSYYKSQGAPGDQNALRELLREVQRESGGSIPASLLSPLCLGLGVKEGLLLALIKRTPSLRLKNTHLVEICAGPNCGKAAALAAFAEKAFAGNPNYTLKFVPCMRQCGKGPNIRWDGTLYHQVDEALLRRLLSEL